MTYCSQCQRKVVILLHTYRNPGSYRYQTHRGFKDHDLCRQCYRAVMGRELNKQRVGHG